MTTRDDKEYNKFQFENGKVALKTAEGVGPASAVLVGNIDELEAKKFTASGSVRIITTY